MLTTDAGLALTIDERGQAAAPEVLFSHPQPHIHKCWVVQRLAWCVRGGVGVLSLCCVRELRAISQSSVCM